MKQLSILTYIMLLLITNSLYTSQAILIVPIAEETTELKLKPLSKQSTTQINPNLQKILHLLAQLPDYAQPKDPAETLKLIRKGYQVLQSIYAKKFFDACCVHYVSAESKKILQLALNSNDEQFWKIASTDLLLEHELKKCNLAHSHENFLSLNYNMLFRIMYAQIHITSPQDLHQFKQEYQQALIALEWYLFSQAILQDSIFISGMIVIPDPEYKIFNFMNGYAELVSPCYRFYSGLHPHSLWQTQAYTRKSSHWNGQKQFNDTNFGIDLKDEQGKKLNLFPCNKSHLLFGLLKNNMTFIKWEEYGTTINFKTREFSAIKHTMRYVQKHNKEDKQLERREKIPQDILLQFRSLYPERLTKYQLHQIMVYGISRMLEFLDPQAQDLFTNYLTQRKKYHKETLHVRKGNEIILQPRKFVSFT